MPIAQSAPAAAAYLRLDLNVHRLDATLEQFLDIEKHLPKSIVVDDAGYQPGDLIRICYYEHGRLKWLLGRVITSVLRNLNNLDDDTCIITIT